MSAPDEESNAAAAGHVASMNSAPTAMPMNEPFRSSPGREMTASVSAATLTITEEARLPRQDELLILSLRSRPSVRWDENVVDNEGLGRKSSKRCCIFHKQRSFGESSTDSDYDSDRSGSSSGTSSSAGAGDQKKAPRKQHKKKIARPRNGKKVPDSQRFHA